MEKTSKCIKTLAELYKYVPCVALESKGRFKYVQIYVSLKSSDSKESICFIRGSPLPYHADVFEAFQDEVGDNKLLDDLLYQPSEEKAGVKIRDLLVFDCPGGGRIEHDSTEKKIFVYGYSQGFGRADHATSTKLIKEAFSGYPSENITWSNDGY